MEQIYPGRGDNRGNVELWLLSLETMMGKTIRRVTEDAMKNFAFVPTFDKVRPRNRKVWTAPSLQFNGQRKLFYVSRKCTGHGMLLVP